MFTTLIPPTDLHAQLDSVRVVDCRFELAKPIGLANPNAGEVAYAASHIPGAVYAHLDRDLSSPITPVTGRHPLPNPHELAAKLGSWGIDSNTQVVAYDADAGMFAARLWWLLRWLGHERVAVLNGGFKAWQQAGLPVTSEIVAPAQKHFSGNPRNELWVSAADVAARTHEPHWRVLDARAPERYRGEVEPIDSIAGHVPGAVNHPFALNLNASAQFLSADELRARYAQVSGGAPPNQVIAMCGSGVTACHNLLAMEVAGLHGAKLYAGSWSEWIRDPHRPIAKGTENNA
jgi:thiosulfate/3-mercaptopyruvate sulfurtransferase